MLKNLFRNYIFPVVVFSGGIIGVGFLALPYVAMKSGIWITLFYFILLTSIVVLVSRIFSEISLKTPDFKRFPGFARHYFGKWGGVFALICTIFSSIGVLLVYLLVGGRFIYEVFSPVVGGSPVQYTFLYFFIASVLIFLGIKIIARAEFWILSFLVLSVLFIFIKGFPDLNLQNFFWAGESFKISNLFLPYGPILFSLWGVGLIPEVEEMLGRKKKLLKTVVTFSILFISVFYFLFVLLILGLTGENTTPTALTGLKEVLTNGLVSVALFAGFLATFTAFITQGITLKKVFIYDLKIKPWQALVMTCFTPMILFLAGFNSFIALVSFLGGILFGVFGIMILLMYKKIGGKKILIYPLFLIFLLGIIYEILSFIKIL